MVAQNRGRGIFPSDPPGGLEGLSKCLLSPPPLSLSLSLLNAHTCTHAPTHTHKPTHALFYSGNI